MHVLLVRSRGICMRTPPIVLPSMRPPPVRATPLLARAPLALLSCSLTNRRSTLGLGSAAAAMLVANLPSRRALAFTTAHDGRTTLETLINQYRLVSAEAPEPNNIFKRILEGRAPAKGVEDDGDLFTFNDRKPASKLHLLVIPKRFVRDASQLSGPDDAALVRRMEIKAIELVRKEVGPENFDANELALGFHWPPWYSVPWLHLHAIYPRSEMSRRYKYTPFSFYSPERVIRRIEGSGSWFS